MEEKLKPRLYRARDLPGMWVAEDEHGVLMVWPAEPRGWRKRTAYTGPKRTLELVEPALARGTGWAGGGRAHKPRSATGRPAKPVSIRATEEEREAWEGAAKHLQRTLSDWCRGELNDAALRIRGSEAAPRGSKQR